MDSWTDEHWNGTHYVAQTTGPVNVGGNPGFYPVHSLADLFLWMNPSLGMLMDSTNLGNGLHTITLDFTNGSGAVLETSTPLQILESFAHFANTLRSELPNTRIAYISVKPSPSREKLMAQVRETNNVIAAYLRRLPNSEYIDVFTPMMGADGRPRAELFLGDRLHMNDEGYRLWQSVIVQYLPDPATRVDASVAQGMR